MPPQLAPLSAKLTASPRFCSNHGAMMVLMAALLIDAQPTDMTRNVA
jgi:hypothetical protein